MATDVNEDAEVSARPPVSLVVISADVMHGPYGCIVTTSSATVKPVVHNSGARRSTTLSWFHQVCTHILPCIRFVSMRCSNDMPLPEWHKNVLPVTDNNC